MKLAGPYYKWCACLDSVTWRMESVSRSVAPLINPAVCLLCEQFVTAVANPPTGNSSHLISITTNFALGSATWRPHCALTFNRWAINKRQTFNYFGHLLREVLDVLYFESTELLTSFLLSVTHQQNSDVHLKFKLIGLTGAGIEK
jgi:hypothetical protein